MAESDGGGGGDGDGEGGGVRPLRVGGLMVGGRPLPLSPAWMGEEELAAVEGLRATIGAALLGSLPDPDALLQAGAHYNPLPPPPPSPLYPPPIRPYYE